MFAALILTHSPEHIEGFDNGDSLVFSGNGSYVCCLDPHTLQKTLGQQDLLDNGDSALCLLATEAMLAALILTHSRAH